MNQQEFSAVTPEFERLAKLCESHDMIDPELYTKYQVKRGLRDLDGKGVLTGATFSTKIEQVDILDSQCENRLSDHGSNAGGLTGPLYRSVVKNCSVKGGNVYAKDCAGGISSSMSEDSEIIDCYSTCRIEGITNVGGITGKVN